MSGEPPEPTEPEAAMVPPQEGEPWDLSPQEPAPALPLMSGSDRWLRAVAAIGGMMGIFVFYSLAQVGLIALLPDDFRLALVIAQVGCLLLPALGMMQVMRAMGLAPLSLPRRRPRPAVALGVVTWTSGLALVSLGLVAGLLALAAPDLFERLLRYNEQMFEPLFRMDSPADAWEIVLVLSLVPAVCEEVLFRGFLQGMLRGVVSPRWAIGISAVLFALVHVEPVGFAGRVIIGVGLGIALERTGSLLLPMAGHAFHNLVVVLLFPWDAPTTVPLPHEAVVLLVVSVPAISVAGFLWWRALRALPAPGVP